jgi:hypothetical protein
MASTILNVRPRPPIYAPSTYEDSTEGGDMGEVLLFHHARTFPSIDEGMAYAQELGVPDEIVARGERAAGELPNGLVDAGFSLGVLPAQKLAQTRAGARGALLFYSCVPTEYFGFWPAGLPVQIHGMDADPIFVDKGTSTRRASLSPRPTAASSTSIRPTSTISPTPACRRTTPRRRPSAPSGADFLRPVGD